MNIPAGRFSFSTVRVYNTSESFFNAVIEEKIGEFIETELNLFEQQNHEMYLFIYICIQNHTMYICTYTYYFICNLSQFKINCPKDFLSTF